MSDLAGVTLTVTVAIAVATSGIVVVETMDLEWNDRACEVNLGEEWEYVNNSVDIENQTVLCRAPNGTVVEADRAINLTEPEST